MMSDKYICSLLLKHHFGLVRWFQRVLHYELEDLAQECQLYLAKRPRSSSDPKFVRQYVKMAMVDLMRSEMGQPRLFCTHEAYERGSKRYARFCAESHSFDNPHDPITQTMVVEPQASDLPSVVAAAMDELTLREWWVLVERYWFDQDQEAIGRRCRVTAARICQIIAGTFPKLRRALPPKGDLL